MYSLPLSFDSSYLTGKQVDSVCFLEYQVNIYFSDEVLLQIEGRFEFVDALGAPEELTNFPLLSSRLPSLVGDHVKELSFDRASGNLRLLFAKGAVLFVAGDSGPYESYRLSRRDESIVI